ncbi:hypothetical protein BVX98_05770 [bacterium F11]|nr:hypothetical protein BVX98_05770 [bacterium F11]
MKKFQCLTILLVLTFFLSSVLMAEKKDSQLRRFEDEINKKEEKKEKKERARTPNEYEEKSCYEKRKEYREKYPWDDYPPSLEDCEADKINDTIMGTFLVVYILGSPFHLPYSALNDEYGKPFGYQSYPFEEGNGLLNQSPKHWSFNTNFLIQVLPGDTIGYRGDAHLTVEKRFNLETSLTKYEERINNRMEYLSFTEVLGTVTFAKNNNWNFRAGLGLERISGEKVKNGMKFVYKVRLFQKPIQANLDLGVTTGLGSPLWEIAPRVGLHFNRIEGFVGYRQKRISGENIRGPEFGLRFWF